MRAVEKPHREASRLRRDLEGRLVEAIQRTWTNRAKGREYVLDRIPGYLDRMAGMGQELRSFVAERFPGFPLPPEPASRSGYLPPLSDDLAELARRRRRGDLVA